MNSTKSGLLGIMKIVNIVVNLIEYHQLNETFVLLLKRTNGPYKNQWALPGGKVEFGERLSEAIIRETKEETGILELKNLNLFLIVNEVVSLNNTRHDHFLVNFFSSTVDNNLVESSTEGELRWFTFENLPKKLVPSDRKAIELWFKSSKSKSIEFRECDLELVSLDQQGESVDLKLKNWMSEI